MKAKAIYPVIDIGVVDPCETRFIEFSMPGVTPLTLFYVKTEQDTELMVFAKCQRRGHVTVCFVNNGPLPVAQPPLKLFIMPAASQPEP